MESMQDEIHDELLIEDRGPVRFMRINRPKTHNSIPKPMVDRMMAAIEQAEQNTELRVVVIGSIGPHFSSGYDMTTHGKSKLGATKVGILDDVQRPRKNNQQFRRMWESGIR